MRSQLWFEMDDVKASTYGGGEWTPLWVYEISSKGEQFSSSYEEEILRIRTLFAPLTNKGSLFERWLDFDPDEVYPCVDHGNYCKPGVYYLDSRAGYEGGEYPVFGYETISGETSGLQISQDLVAALRLVQRGTDWVRPCESDQVVIRQERSEGGKTRGIYVRTESLRDYLCARGMGLYIEEFRHRQVNDTDCRTVLWKSSPIVERRIARDGIGKYEWKGWMFKHLNRDNWSDAKSVSKDILKAPQFYRVEGQLWKQLWVNPASKSERVAGDDLELEYYVLPNGQKHVISPLDDAQYGHVYLFFKVELVQHVLSAGARMVWEAHDVFSVAFPSGSRVMFGISKAGTCFCISADIARLESWEQSLVQCDNIRPAEQSEYFGSELFQNQMMCEFLHTKAPEGEFPILLEEFGRCFEVKTGSALWQKFDAETSLVSSISRFCSTDQDGFIQLAKCITEVLIERMDKDALRTFINGRVETAQMGSIGLLTAALTLIKGKIDWNVAVGFMRDMNYIRQAAAHLMPTEEICQRINIVKVKEGISWIDRGCALLENVNLGLKNMLSMLS